MDKGYIAPDTALKKLRMARSLSQTVYLYGATGNNIKKGTATVLIRGKGAYSGVKSITFKIVAVDNGSIWKGVFR